MEKLNHLPSNLRAKFISEMSSQFKELRSSLNLDERTRLSRALHSIKGLAAAVELHEITALTHLLEDTVDSGHFAHIHAAGKELLKRLSVYDELNSTPQAETLTEIFDFCHRAGSELAQQLNKDIDFLFQGPIMELPPLVAAAILVPLLQLIRNAIDHGIESNQERELLQKGKAKIIVTAQLKNQRLSLEVLDDGKGIPQHQLGQILKPGFSTAPIKTEVSGRGMGLDVVNENLKRINGSLVISSRLQVGSSFRLSIPLEQEVSQSA